VQKEGTENLEQLLGEAAGSQAKGFSKHEGLCGRSLSSWCSQWNHKEKTGGLREVGLDDEVMLDEEGRIPIGAEKSSSGYQIILVVLDE
jgi:hypothetical protein